MTDEFGRVLAEPVNLSFFTDHRRPDFHIGYDTAVLEKQLDTDVPLFVTNLDEIGLDFSGITTQGRTPGQNASITLPFAEDTSFAVPIGVRDMLKGESGAVYGRVSSSPGVSKSDFERNFFAQVTPYQVFVKAGHYNTLVWVTDLQSGLPVDRARVSIYRDSVSSLADNKKTLSEAVTDNNGKAVISGIAELDPDLKAFQWGQDRDRVIRLFVLVSKGGDMALLPLDYRFMVDTWAPSSYTVYSSMKAAHGHIHAWGATAQGVYRAGDTVQYKFYVRNQDNETFVNAPRKGYALRIIDPAGRAVHEIKGLTLSEFGAYDGEFTVSKNGTVGWYSFQLSADFTKETWQPIRVLVSDFTPAPFRVLTELEGDLFKPGDRVDVSTAAALHSGGPYSHASARITASLKKGFFSPGHPVLKGFQFDTDQYDTRSPLTLFQKTGHLSDQGELASSFILPDRDIIYGRITVESAVQDDRGKYVAASASADYIGRDRFVGLRSTEWIYYEDKPARVEFAVVDEHGNIAADTDVTVNLERLETKAARVKGAGNAYLAEYIDEWVQVSSQEFKSANEPGAFEFVPDEPGSYRVSAEIADTGGRRQGSRVDLWVAGKGHVVWHEPDDFSLKLVPEKENYKVGEMARCMIKNPLPDSKALITVERYGVLKSWVQTFTDSTPVIEFPIEPEYLPGFYLSVVVMSPRVDKPLGDGQVDLGKPAFRIGYARVRVKDRFKEIDVRVNPEKDTFRPGEKVRVSLNAKACEAIEDEAIELAVAVLDEAVFDLLFQGNDLFDPYKGFYHLDELDVSNYSLLTRLVGRQKFEKKGASAGGDGGADLSLRSEFKFVSYWNPSLEADAKGNAVIEFECPDNLTSWRIFVMAVTPSDRMGLGYSSFKVNRPTEVMPVMPNQVTEGDSFSAGFSVMNRTENNRELTVTVNLSGSIDDTTTPVSRSDKIILPPYERKTVYMPVQTKGSGKIEFRVTAGDSSDRDGLYHHIPVRRLQSLETSMNYGTLLDQDIEEEIMFPENIHGDMGKVSVSAAPTVIGKVDGAFRYMRDYPYGCWEQKLSRGVMASHYANMRRYLPEDCSWDGAELLPENVLSEAADFQAPNGGMAYFVPKDSHVCPYLSAYTALAFKWLRKGGCVIPEIVEKKLHEYLKNILRHDAFPEYFSKGMVSTVRAVALAALAGSDVVSINDLYRFFPSVPSMSLFGKAHFLLAALELRGAEDIINEVFTRILAHAEQTGGKFHFNEEHDNAYGRILSTPMRTASAILSAISALSAEKEYSELAGDIPFRIVRNIIQRRSSRDQWENTQENIFCLSALIDYSKIFEQESPDMTVRAFLDAAPVGGKYFSELQSAPFVFEKPVARDDPGKKSKITIRREGKGRLYYSAGVTFAPLKPNAERINAGMEIRREYSVFRDNEWVLLTSPVKVRRGELIRVDIFLSLPGERNFVVVSDAVPGGLEPVNRNLATASAVDASMADEFEAAPGSWWYSIKDWHSFNESRWFFYHQELGHDSVRFYSDYLYPGNYHLSYVSQAIASGEFVTAPVHAEQLYDPDVYGKGLAGILEVTESKEN
ncbi:MAG: large extracellular alpha-helical protein [Deltaproteobacteria bacterium]|nr:large extracellular alpha-helical protein [Deltaproteobacteria bacterium]